MIVTITQHSRDQYCQRRATRRIVSTAAAAAWLPHSKLRDTRMANGQGNQFSELITRPKLHSANGPGAVGCLWWLANVHAPVRWLGSTTARLFMKVATLFTTETRRTQSM